MESSQVYVFNLDDDPDQIRPDPGTHPEFAPLVRRARTALQKRWTRWFARTGGDGEGMGPGAGEEDREYREALERMRSLGYMK